MNRIDLENTLPNVFIGQENISSDIWLKNITFEKNQRYLIEAASGVGKSSLCSFIFGSRKDYAGEITFDKQNIKGFSVDVWDVLRMCHISLLFQELRLFSELTAFENVIIKNNLMHYKSEQEIKMMFEFLNIEDKIDHRIDKLSWGQRQRVAVIRALCQPFDFLFLDEPISHLDNENAGRVAELVEQEAAKQQATIITTSIGKHLSLNYDKTFAL